MQGYLLKNLEAEDFFSLLDRAAEGEPALTPALARKLLQEFAKPQTEAKEDPDALTAREHEVLETPHPARFARFPLPAGERETHPGSKV